MKIIEVLKNIKKYQQLSENAETEKAKTALTSTADKYKNQYKDAEALSKDEVNEKWNNALASQGAFENFINNTITLLSNLLTVPVNEVFETYDEHNLKTMFWLMHNSNYKLNAIIERMRQTNIGKLEGYTPGGNRKLQSKDGFFDEDGNFDANTDLFDLIKSLFFYKNGEWVDAFYDFYDKQKFVTLTDLTSVTLEDNLFDILSKTGLPTECLIELASIQGSKTPNRGKFETLLVLLSQNGKFQAGKLDTYDSAGNLYRNELNGDIIINGVPIEVKTNMGSGGGRVGGQGGFNGIGGIRNSYLAGLKEFLTFYKNTFHAELQANENDEINVDDEAKNNMRKLLEDSNTKIAAYEQCNDIALRPGTKYTFIDTIIGDICELIVRKENNIDNINPSLAEEIKNQIVNFYFSIWGSNADESGSKKKGKSNAATGANKAIRNLIQKAVQTTTIVNIAKTKRVIPEDNFYDFTQKACACMLGHYASIEDFEYMFIINTDPAKLKIPEAHMLVLEKSKLVGFIKDPGSILTSGLYFSELPTTYGSNPARATRPMLAINS